MEAQRKIVEMIRDGSNLNCSRLFPRTEVNSSQIIEIMVSAAGFEPATHALKGHCSTN